MAGSPDLTNQLKPFLELVQVLKLNLITSLSNSSSPVTILKSPETQFTPASIKVIHQGPEQPPPNWSSR
ncbi:hypothetical protein PGTUg99_019982 [Puccinia graminis f. sp. tritici]|uniref:Uncharacterized protein n=1 Tax=Puccinia graminis f. sp. tritici TaxID=56615 RepID=A0A5B0NWZ0_PUCGR|nr:hypothetical protein PGTUg99_019982 [Puccinia graminis f. sp. tritici]